MKNENRKRQIIEILKKICPIFLFGVAFFILLKTANAESYLGDNWDQYLNNLPGWAPNNKGGEELASMFIQNAVKIIRYLVGGVALLMGLLYGMNLIFARGKEDAIAKQKTNFLWVLLGFVILIISENIANIFNPETATAEKIIDFNAGRDQLRDVINYIKWFMGSIIVLMMSISGIRMITAQGDEETIKKQKNNLTWSIIGMLFMLLASNIVNAIYVIKSPNEISAGTAGTTIEEIAGIIRLILVFLGPIAIILTIIAGLMYLSALDNEERLQKAKRMIVGGITGIIIIYASYAIVNTITAEKLAAFYSVFTI